MLLSVCVIRCDRYIGVLVDLTHISGASLHNARAITHQLTDVSIRVPGVRRYAVKAMCDVLLAGRLLTASGANNCMSEVLHAAAFIVGEFSEYVDEHVEVIRCMMRREVGGLSGETQNVFVQSVMKVLAAGLYQPYNQQGEDKDVSMDVKVKDLLGRRHVEEDDDEKEEDGDEVKEQLERPTAVASSQQAEDAEPEHEEEELDENGVKKRKVKAKRRTYHDYVVFVGEMLECLYTHLPLFCRSSHVEVQERAVSYHELVCWLVHYAQMQPFISVNVQSKTGRGSGDANSATNGEKADKAQSSGAAASPALDLLDDSSSTPSQTQSNEALPPAAALSSLGVQLCTLFSERLNPVNPKAQKKVPVPKGLDLNQPIHEGWDVDSEASESDDDGDDSDGNDRGSSSRRDRHDKSRHEKGKGKDREREKGNKEKKRGKKARESGGLYSEEEYSAPLTAEEKEDAKRRLEARKQAQMNDPFYLVDRKAAGPTAAAAGEASQLRQASKDELPSTSSSSSGRRDSDRDRKRSSKKHRGGGGAGEDDDIFAGVEDSKPKKQYKVHNREDMPSDALSSEEERAANDDADDGANKKRKHRDNRDKDSDRDKDKKRKKDKDRKGDKEREKGRKDRDEEKDGDEQGKDKERRRKERKKDGKAAVDEFDPMNDSRAASDKSDEVDRKKKEKDRGSKRNGTKDKDREKDKDRKRERSRA